MNSFFFLKGCFNPLKWPANPWKSHLEVAYHMFKTIGKETFFRGFFPSVWNRMTQDDLVNFSQGHWTSLAMNGFNLFVSHVFMGGHTVDRRDPAITTWDETESSGVNNKIKHTYLKRVTGFPNHRQYIKKIGPFYLLVSATCHPLKLKAAWNETLWQRAHRLWPDLEFRKTGVKMLDIWKGTSATKPRQNI